MRNLRRSDFRAPAVWLLALLFLAGQSFACCYAPARLGRSLVSVFASAPAAHACCAKPASAEAPARSPDKAPCNRTCCIKDASARAPQLASVPADLPIFAGIPLAFLPAVTLALPQVPRAVPAPDTGPPVYLKTLRLLV